MLNMVHVCFVILYHVKHGTCMLRERLFKFWFIVWLFIYCLMFYLWLLYLHGDVVDSDEPLLYAYIRAAETSCHICSCPLLATCKRYRQETLVHAPMLYMGRKNFQESINYCFHKQKVTVYFLHNMYVDEFRGDPLFKTARKYINKEMVKFRGVSKNEMTLYL